MGPRLYEAINRAVGGGGTGAPNLATLKAARPSDVHKLLAISGVALSQVTTKLTDMRTKAGNAPPGQRCAECGIDSTPVWRRGTEAQPLCNACGVKNIRAAAARGQQGASGRHAGLFSGDVTAETIAKIQEFHAESELHAMARADGSHAYMQRVDMSTVWLAFD